MIKLIVGVSALLRAMKEKTGSESAGLTSTEMIDDLKSIRQHIHQHPELSGAGIVDVGGGGCHL